MSHGRLSAVTLREDFHPSAKSPLKVDREKGVIYRVKILGWESANRRRYLPEAGKAAQQLYEGAKAYCDHPDRPNQSRETGDALGIWRNPDWTPQGIYADLHYLKSHPMAERVCEDAERGLGVFGASHNADGEGENQGGVLVVHKITEVRSVDLVTDPATVSNLWESRKRPMKRVKVQAFLESNRASLTFGQRKLLKRLLEWDDAAGGMAPDAMEMDEPADEGDWKQDLVSAIGKLVASDDGEAHDMAGKIMRMLKPASADVEEEDDEADEGDDKAVEEEDESGDDKEKKESRKGRKPAPGSQALTEARVQQLVELAGVKSDKALLEGLLAMRDETAILSHLKYLKSITKGGDAGKSTGSGARSQAPGSFTESRNRPAPKDAKEFAGQLLS